MIIATLYSNLKDDYRELALTHDLFLSFKMILNAVFISSLDVRENSPSLFSRHFRILLCEFHREIVYEVNLELVTVTRGNKTTVVSPLSRCSVR